MDKKLVITIEREYGSGGRVLGKTLSEQLGIPCIGAVRGGRAVFPGLR